MGLACALANSDCLPWLRSFLIRSSVCSEIAAFAVVGLAGVDRGINTCFFYGGYSAVAVSLCPSLDFSYDGGNSGL